MVILIHDGARYHTSKATRTFLEQHKERLTVYQLPSYSPDYNPIEDLWKKVKTHATHNRYFAEFVMLVNSVDQALTVLTTQSTEILRLMEIYTRAHASFSCLICSKSFCNHYRTRRSISPAFTIPTSVAFAVSPFIHDGGFTARNWLKKTVTSW